MKRRYFALALLLPCLAFAQSKEPAKAPAKPAAPAASSSSATLATVNGVAIPRQRLEIVVQQQVARGATDNEQLRSQVREALINNELLIQEANRSGIAQKAEARARVRHTRQ